MLPPRPLKIFCSYAHKDESLREELDTHLAMIRRKGVATFWSDREINAGSDWAGQIDQNLRTADIILLLLSANFLASDYCFNIELRQAIERHRRREAVLIPIVLRPCQWNRVPYEGGEFDLSDLQALPAGLVPVTRWPDHHDAFDNIAQGIAKVVQQLASGGAVTWGETTVTLPERVPAPPAPPVPDLLPYLCDRTMQEALLRRAVHAWRARGLAKRPFVCVVHGGDDEAIDWFRRRLHEVTLPAMLSARAEGDAAPLYDPALGRIDDIPVELPPFIEPGAPFDFLREEVGMSVADNMYATPASVAEALSAKDVPTLFTSHLASCDWAGEGERVVDAFLNFWASLPDVKAGRALSFLFFKYSGAGADCPPRLAEVNARAEAFFNGLGARLPAYEGAHALVLPRLPAVGQGDAEAWVRSREHFRKLCHKHPLYFCNVERAVQDIESIYTDPLMRIPMERLAPRLHAVINNHRCGGAA